MGDRYTVRILKATDEPFIRKIQKENEIYREGKDAYYGSKHNIWLEKAIRELKEGSRVAFAAFISDEFRSAHRDLSTIDIVGLVFTKKKFKNISLVELKSYMVNPKAVLLIERIVLNTSDQVNSNSDETEDSERFRIRKMILDEVKKYYANGHSTHPNDTIKKIDQLRVKIPITNSKLRSDAEELGFEPKFIEETNNSKLEIFEQEFV